MNNNDLHIIIKTGMDGTHQQMHQGPSWEERQKAFQRTRRRLGAGLRGCGLHGLQEVPVQRPQ